MEGANPHIGEVGVLCVQDEYKVEVCCPSDRLERTVRAIREVHPYEEPVINVIPLIAQPM